MIATVFGVLFFAAIYFYMRYDELKKSEKQRIREERKLNEQKEYLENRLKELQKEK